MITLFVKTGCPYCAKVIATVKELELPYTERNIADPENVKALLDEGGKQQVPFIEYESDTIVAYLHEKYGSREAKKKPVLIHIAGSGVCSSHVS
jgi:glutaredoxin